MLPLVLFWRAFAPPSSRQRLAASQAWIPLPLPPCPLAPGCPLPLRPAFEPRSAFFPPFKVCIFPLLPRFLWGFLFFFGLPLPWPLILALRGSLSLPSLCSAFFLYAYFFPFMSSPSLLVPLALLRDFVSFSLLPVSSPTFLLLRALRPGGLLAPVPVPSVQAFSRLGLSIQGLRRLFSLPLGLTCLLLSIPFLLWPLPVHSPSHLWPFLALLPLLLAMPCPPPSSVRPLLVSRSSVCLPSAGSPRAVSLTLPSLPSLPLSAPLDPSPLCPQCFLARRPRHSLPPLLLPWRGLVVPSYLLGHLFALRLPAPSPPPVRCAPVARVFLLSSAFVVLLALFLLPSVSLMPALAVALLHHSPPSSLCAFPRFSFPCCSFCFRAPAFFLASVLLFLLLRSFPFVFPFYSSAALLRLAPVGGLLPPFPPLALCRLLSHLGCLIPPSLLF